jgi:hypothetical protein
VEHDLFHQPWVEEVRRRCPMLDLGFVLDGPPREDAAEGDEEEPPREEETAVDDLADMSDPYQVLSDQLDEAGRFAAVALRELRQGWGEGKGREVGALLDGADGLVLLLRARESRGEAFAAAVAELGHKLPLAFAPADFGPLVREASAEVSAIEDVVARLLARIEREVG